MKAYYQAGGITLYCARAEDVLPGLEAESVDLVLTDPPYEKEAHDITRRTRAFLEGRNVYQDIPFDKMTEELREFICGIPCNWLLVFCQAEAVGLYQRLLGPKYRRPMIWIKPDSCPQFTGDRPAMGYESIIAAWGAPGRSRWNAGGKRGVYTAMCSSGRQTTHPTEKPLVLIKELLLDFSLGGIVLDCFAGSGTTLVAAKQLGRNGIGVEVNEEYCQIAVRRLEKVEQSPPMPGFAELCEQGKLL